MSTQTSFSYAHLLTLLRNWLLQSFRLKTPLAKIIGGLIRNEGPITLKRYMEIVLHHSEHGYYSQGNPLGERGDFGTFPEISQLFGEMVGAWCVTSWEKLGKPDDFILLELGPGRGTMMKYALRITAAHENFHQALRLHLVESNTTLRHIQRDLLITYNPVFLEVDDLSHLPPLPIICLANEFFDTLPIQQFIKTDLGWQERLVDLKNGAFVFADTSVQRPMSSLHPDLESPKWVLNSVYEMSPQSHEVIQQIASHIQKHKGASLIIDYGYTKPSLRSSLEAWSQHTYVGIFTEPGKVDVTSDVDFMALRKTAEMSGVFVDGPIWQGDFIKAMGVDKRAQALKKDASSSVIKAIDEEVDRLTNRTGLGQDFKAMMFRSWA